ncbi:NAD-dependent malic enzyme, putative [Entamoeba invadens IP1]|uniref:NAD-dependent malic enzyme, putative n=1 Tax=Entamoeba invadens IP1 TaxID=370355 RepID=A0A0A1U1P6_ENTIV|nr:NAD-dependent malic enzyme, putative [Entamoeba invadens IP1]ELP87963.1 NAD-dependent malic enzyme, putative [Entamoeba invadens IP1]|eukprot:XP_004254734.1 NAD-dependent malic enzyme, putative [Entamoeba invadens IP1]
MTQLKQDLTNLDECLPSFLTQEQRAVAQTEFYKTLAEKAHKFYRGKIQIMPKCTLCGFNWFNAYYTPGVSRISTNIRDDNDSSLLYTMRGNFVGVVSDSTRVLGDGDVTPAGGLGVMEGKALLMKYLGGIDAVPICIDSKVAGKNDADAMIEFVQRIQHTFGAINLEDISQPNCYRVLDVLRETCDIPVWHDDQQGTASVTLAGLLNALKLVHKRLEDIKMVFIGAGSANATCLRLIVSAGADPKKIVMFDINGSLHSGREDIEKDSRFYRQWEICKTTNPDKIKTIPEAIRGADVLISLSAPGPGVVKGDWIRSMGTKPIVFCCANPVPEIYPYEAKEAGAYIVATGRGDFPNQVNNSVGFPGILKGALIVRAKKITDNMAIAASKALADFAEKRGITPDNIIGTMDEPGIFPREAADVAMQAIKDGVARITNLTWQQVYDMAEKDIKEAREGADLLIEKKFIKEFPQDLLDESINTAINVATK